VFSWVRSPPPIYYGTFRSEAMIDLLFLYYTVLLKDKISYLLGFALFYLSFIIITDTQTPR